MADVDAAHRGTLTHFGVYQMSLNPAGIGNECTHWIYAALFEARALDHSRALHIAQGHRPFTWGRPVGTKDVQRGDIAQFHGFQNNFLIYQEDDSGFWTVTGFRIRGPDHTGMVFIPPKGGTYYQLESHLHQPGITRMRIRGNTIYQEPFAVALSAAELQQVRSTDQWPSRVDDHDLEDLLEHVDWTGLRDRFGIPMLAAHRLAARAKAVRAPGILQSGSKKIACLFVATAVGSLKFYCPQASDARLAMDDAQLAEEKAKVIHSMILGGRRGGRPDEDEYGGDNKAKRLHDDRFDWTYDPSWTPSP